MQLKKKNFAITFLQVGWGHRLVKQRDQTVYVDMMHQSWYDFCLTTYNNSCSIRKLFLTMGQRQLQSIQLSILEFTLYALFANLLPFPAGARVHLIASCNPYWQDKGLGLLRMGVAAAAAAEARLAAVWTGAMVTLHFCCTGTTTSPLCLTSDRSRSALGPLFCFSLYFLMYPKH